MFYHPRLHSFSHLAKAMLGRLGRLTGDQPAPGDLIVLNYHGTQKKFFSSFQQQITRLQKRYTFISPAQLDDYFANKLSLDRPAALISFDDGIRSNLDAAEWLEQQNIRAIFFVVPGFIDTPPEKQKEFFLRNIRPHINPAIDTQPEDFSAMTWSELTDLHRRGHAIGAHTITHTLVAATSSEENAAYEIVTCKELIEKKISAPVDCFCAPNNSLLSCGAKEMALVKKHYRYFFSTLPGSNLSREPYFIRRANMESHWMRGAFDFAVGKKDWARWENAVQQFQKNTLSK